MRPSGKAAAWPSLAAALLALGIVLVLGACRPAPAGARRVVVAYPLAPSTLVPDAALEEISISILSNVFESLVTVEGGVVPVLARSWETTDERTWTFVLRPNVRFHDGHVLQARDVVASLEHARTHSDSGFRSLLAVIESAEAPAPDRVIIHTREPCGDLLYRLPPVWLASAGGLPVGTGPYRVARFTPGRMAELEAFPGYRGTPPDEQRLECRAIPDAEARLAALARGDVHLVADPPSDLGARLGGQPGLRLLARAGLRVVLLGADCVRERRTTGDRNPFHDARVRRAIQLAVDRTALVSGPLAGLAEPVHQIVVPEVFGYAAGLGPVPFDPEGARGLLRSAGFAGGFDVELDYPRGKYRSIEAVASAVSSQLRTVGIRVQPRPWEADEFFNSLLKQGSPFFLTGWASSQDAGPTYDYLVHSNVQGLGTDNDGGFVDTRVDEALDEARRTIDPERRLQALARAARRVRDEAPLIPLYRQTDLYAVAAGLEFQPRLDRKVLGVMLRWSAAAP